MEIRIGHDRDLRTVPIDAHIREVSTERVVRPRTPHYVSNRDLHLVECLCNGSLIIGIDDIFPVRRLQGNKRAKRIVEVANHGRSDRFIRRAVCGSRARSPGNPEHKRATDEHRDSTTPLCASPNTPVLFERWPQAGPTTGICVSLASYRLKYSQNH